MTDDLLTTFRSDVPLPDDASAKRAYERAIGGRRRMPRRRLSLALAAVIIGVTIPAVVVTSLGGGGGERTLVRGGNRAYDYQSEEFRGSDHSITSIAVRIRATTSNATLRLQVFRSETSQPPPPSSDNAGSQIVFQEQIPMTDLESPLPDGTLSTWDGTLRPSDWNGGCHDALYRIETTVYPVGNSSPWGGGYTAWFQCSGPGLDPTNPIPH
jgi:hypothetical protein